MAKFYFPVVIAVRNTPVIVYPCEGVEQLLRRDDPGSVARHLKELYERRNLENSGGFDMSILWEEGGDLMTDRWKITNLESWGSGALSDAKTYRGFIRTTKMGTSAEFGHIVLGEEAKHRLFTCGEDMRKFLDSRPALPSAISNSLNYFVNA